MDALGWIVAAFLAGCIAAGWRTSRRESLRRRFERLDFTDGRDFAEIVALVGRPPWGVRPAEGGRRLRTWREGDYAITLLFDGEDRCLGVMEEREGRP